MKIEQLTASKIKVTLETDLEKATLGKAETIELVIEQVTATGFTEQAAKRTALMSKP